MVIASILLTAVCWGVYGPVLHQGQAAMGQGRLRAFLCVGLAYFVIAVIIPMVMIIAMKLESDSKFDWTAGGLVWSLAAGAAGAIGALGIILAMNYGGKPLYVMPLVFGLAPIFNTLFSSWLKGSWEFEWQYFAGVGLAIVGAGLVLTYAPKGSAAPHGGGSSVGKPDHNVTPLKSNTDESKSKTNDAPSEPASGGNSVDEKAAAALQ